MAGQQQRARLRELFHASVSCSRPLHWSLICYECTTRGIVRLRSFVGIDCVGCYDDHHSAMSGGHHSVADT